jgi:glutathione synthase
MTSRCIAVQMDPPVTLNPAGDSTIAIMREAQARGHSLHYYAPSQLAWQDGAVSAPLQPLHCNDVNAATWFELGEPALTSLAQMDAVLMRQDPPYDMAYLSATYLLEQLPASVVVANPPAYVRNHPEKLAILHYPDAIPPTCISADAQALVAFAQTHKKIVLKPLYGFGGHSVFITGAEDPNLLTLLEQHANHSREPLMAQRFLPEVAAQDIRVLLIAGQVHGVLGRIPEAGSIRANMRVGGMPAKATLSAKQAALCERIGKDVWAQGVLFAGLDFIGEYLTEINITSPTGIVAVEKLYGDACRPAAAFMDGLEGLIEAASL